MRKQLAGYTAALVAEEEKNILSFDIPHFYSELHSLALYSGHKKITRRFFSKSGVGAFNEKISRLQSPSFLTKRLKQIGKLLP